MRLKQIFVGFVLLGAIGCSNGRYAITSHENRALLVDTSTGKVWRYFFRAPHGFRALPVEGLWTASNDPVQ